MQSRYHIINRNDDQQAGYLVGFGSDVKRTVPRFVEGDEGTHGFRIVERTEAGIWQDVAFDAAAVITAKIGRPGTSPRVYSSTATDTMTPAAAGSITVTEVQAGSSTAKEIQQITFTKPPYAGTWVMNFTRAQVTTIQAVPNTGAATVFRFQTIADTAASLNSRFFDYLDSESNKRVWIDVDNTGIAPSLPPSPSNLIEANIASNASAVVVAEAIVTAINTQGDAVAALAYQGASPVVQITTAPGVYSEADVQNSGFTLTIQNGSHGPLQEKYFTISDRNGTVAVWFNVHGGGTIPEGASAASRSIEITSVGPTSNAAAVASAIQTALDADAEFAAVVASGVVTVTDAAAGARAAASAGDAGMPVSVTATGTSVTGLLRYNATEQEVQDVFGSVAAIKKTAAYTWQATYSSLGLQSAIATTSNLSFPKIYPLLIAIGSANLTTDFGADDEIDAIFEVEIEDTPIVDVEQNTVLHVPCRVVRQLIT